MRGEQHAAISRLFRDIVHVAYKKLIEVLSDHEQAFLSVRIGADGAPTTKLDFELERVCIEALQRSGLIAAVLSEEAGEVPLIAGGLFRAILDPLDGTSNAEMQFPYYALSLAITDGAKTVAGLVYNYCSRDVFEAHLGRGATRNGIRIKVNDQAELRLGRIVTSRPFTEVEASMYGRLLFEAKRVRISSSPALDISHVAAGTFMAYVDYHQGGGLIHTHDVAAAALILSEAGGFLADESGGPLDLPLSASTTFNVFALNDRVNFSKVSSHFGLLSDRIT
jgi:myo-inositol-1(or 4)-monophosphatase